MAIDLVEGWTERIVYQLSADGVNQALTGAGVEMLLYDKHNRPVAYSGTAGISDVALGKVYFDPTAADLVNSLSPYEVRWKVTDLSGKIAFFPNGNIELWNVRKP
jgi:hypothetical protein